MVADGVLLALSDEYMDVLALIGVGMIIEALGDLVEDRVVVGVLVLVGVMDSGGVLLALSMAEVEGSLVWVAVESAVTVPEALDDLVGDSVIVDEPVLVGVMDDGGVVVGVGVADVTLDDDGVRVVEGVRVDVGDTSNVIPLCEAEGARVLLAELVLLLVVEAEEDTVTVRL